MGAILNLFLQLLQVFCGGKTQQGHQQQGNQQQGHQQQGYPGGQHQGQQQGGWGQQQYPPQQPQQGTWTSSNDGPGNDQQYQQWRNEARREGDMAHKCFADSQNAYKSGDGGRAHDLSQEGKRHQAKQDQLDDKAAEWIFRENNKTQPHGTIDLHGLYVKEALDEVEKAIANGQRSGLDDLRIITGKGNHSANRQAKIKPAVAEMMRKYNLSAEIDPHNTGVLVVDLQGRQMGGRTRDAGGLVDSMGGDKDGCVIM
ncbi:hypothetical protein CspHIS471_0702940 [Cutaneotrichosporon sp. HIS471]|nr:hypothetical protein CspHIS471_0702940 [Cutaneotrichosporon sp. HIS471]